MTKLCCDCFILYGSPPQKNSPATFAFLSIFEMKIFALMYFCIFFSLYNLGIQDVLYVWKFSKFEMCAGKTGVFLNNTWVQTNMSSVTNIPYAGINNYWMRIE